MSEPTELPSLSDLGVQYKNLLAKKETGAAFDPGQIMRDLLASKTPTSKPFGYHPSGDDPSATTGKGTDDGPSSHPQTLHDILGFGADETVPDKTPEEEIIHLTLLSFAANPKQDRSDLLRDFVDDHTSLDLDDPHYNGKEAILEAKSFYSRARGLWMFELLKTLQGAVADPRKQWNMKAATDIPAENSPNSLAEVLQWNVRKAG